MKKKIIALMLIGTMAFTFMACSDKSETEETTTDETSDAETSETSEETDESATTERDYDMGYDVFDYVTLGNYKGVEVTLDGDYEVTEEDVAEYTDEQIADTCPYVQDDTKTVVEEDSIVNVDYVGSQDGVAFDGGSAEDVTLDIAANGDVSGTTYIDGFTAGLVGSSVGDEVSYEVTFPENYGSDSLAGQTVIFTFQVNWIGTAVTADTLTDEIVSENFDYDSVEAFNQAMVEGAEAEMESTKEDDIRSAVMDTVIANATVSGVPENVLNGLVNMYIVSLTNYYCTDGQTLEEYVTESGDDYDELIDDITTNMTDSLEQELVFEAVSKTENLELDEDSFENMLSYYIYYYGASDEDNLSEMYDTDDFSMIAYIHHIFELQTALDFCADNAVVNE